MTKEGVFHLWGLVQKGDKSAKREFINLYKEKFPNNEWVVRGASENYSKQCLRIMYTNLYEAL